jgi:cysteine desulfurase
MSRVYLDHNATSPMRPEAMRAVSAAMQLSGNASSVHLEGRAARETVEEAREKVAGSLACDARRIVFTSGGTEANVMALSPRWFADGDDAELFTSAIEHPSVLQGGQFRGDRVRQLPVGSNGVVDLEETRQILENRHSQTDAAPFLLSVMLANNETGAIQPVGELARIAHEFGGLMHSDLVQAYGKMQIDPAGLGVDLASLSAHKIGGPKGIGALAILRDGLPVAALLKGGGQESGYRAGTENVPAIAGFGAVADINMMEWQRIGALRDRLEARVKEITPQLSIFCANVPRLPNTSCFAAPGSDSETLLMTFDLGGIAVSAGSACSSGKVARSHVLDAMGEDPTLASAAIRVSLGWNTSGDDIDRFVAAWEGVVRRFARPRTQNVA